MAADDGASVLELVQRLTPGQESVQELVNVALLGLGWAALAYPGHDLATLLDVLLLDYELPDPPEDEP